MPLQIYEACPSTSIYHRKPLVNSKDNSLLVMIPGNPGIVEYYETYVDLIQAKFPQFETLIISQAGIQSSDISKSKGPFVYYGIEDQIDHKLKVIWDFVKDREEKTDLYILSHSFGSYISQRVAKAILEDSEKQKAINLKFVGLICPVVVDPAKSVAGQRLLKFFAYLPLFHIMYFFVSLLQLLPLAWLEFIIKEVTLAKPTRTDEAAQKGFHNSVQATLRLLLSKNNVHEMIALVEEELRRILRDDKMNDWFFEHLSRENNVMIWSYFAESDHWVHDSTRDYILARYAKPSNRNLSFQVGGIGDSELITHSFCVHQSVEFSEITNEIMEHILK